MSARALTSERLRLDLARGQKSRRGGFFPSDKEMRGA